MRHGVRTILYPSQVFLCSALLKGPPRSFVHFIFSWRSVLCCLCRAVPCPVLSCLVLFRPVSLPAETKLKKYMKAIAKEAAAGCALRHREKRAYLREQVKALAGLVGAEPGMLGPKLPMVRQKDKREEAGGGRKAQQREGEEEGEGEGNDGELGREER